MILQSKLPIKQPVRDYSKDREDPILLDKESRMSSTELQEWEAPGLARTCVVLKNNLSMKVFSIQLSNTDRKQP